MNCRTLIAPALCLFLIACSHTDKGPVVSPESNSIKLSSIVTQLQVAVDSMKEATEQNKSLPPFDNAEVTLGNIVEKTSEGGIDVYLSIGGSRTTKAESSMKLTLRNMPKAQALKSVSDEFTARFNKGLSSQTLENFYLDEDTVNDEYEVAFSLYASEKQKEKADSFGLSSPERRDYLVNFFEKNVVPGRDIAKKIVNALNAVAESSNFQSNTLVLNSTIVITSKNTIGLAFGLMDMDGISVSRTHTDTATDTVALTFKHKSQDAKDKSRQTSP